VRLEEETSSLKIATIAAHQKTSALQSFTSELLHKQKRESLATSSQVKLRWIQSIERIATQISVEKVKKLLETKFKTNSNA
jgi:hypothetical protein